MSDLKVHVTAHELAGGKDNVQVGVTGTHLNNPIKDGEAAIFELNDNNKLKQYIKTWDNTNRDVQTVLKREKEGEERNIKLLFFTRVIIHYPLIIKFRLSSMIPPQIWLIHKTNLIFLTTLNGIQVFPLHFP
jgi:hypothetical protein